MKIVQPSVTLINPPSRDDLYKQIERAGRVCYKSEDKITEDSAEKFIRGLIKRGHEAVIEHGSITALFVCDRGVSHELVRHRIASYCQESTRYCNYSKDAFGNEITVIQPSQLERPADDKPEATDWDVWEYSCEQAEQAYFDLLRRGCTPQEARAVLPTCLKTEIMVTMNPREWRHFFKLRCSSAAHPDMRHVALIAQDMFVENWPALFEDLVNVD